MNKEKKETRLSSLIDKAIFDYKMIEKNDRILVGVSGGKDSTALLEYFSNRVKRPECNFEYKALHIHSDFAPPFPKEIYSLIKKWDVPYDVLDVNILERVKSGQKMSCWWCSTQRRTELLNYAIEHGFNKIALGHHLDDMLETFLMNMLGKGEISTMPPCLKYDNFPVTIIRPLIYVCEEKLIKHAVERGYSRYTCTCDYQDNSARKNARKLLEQLTEGSNSKKYMMLNALKNVVPQYLP